MILTQECHKKLSDKVFNMKYKERPIMAEYLEECRLNGSLDDNPEHFQAFEDLQRLDKNIDELSNILSSATIFTDNMKINDTVSFGATVKFKDLDTNEVKTYTILSIYDSDINKGIISIEAPLVKEMIGLHTGDYFEFNERTYEIISICFSSL